MYNFVEVFANQLNTAKFVYNIKLAPSVNKSAPSVFNYSTVVNIFDARR